jgi:fused signal recognition particle receptor
MPMFGFLKKKIDDFSSKLKNVLDSKTPEQKTENTIESKTESPTENKSVITPSITPSIKPSITPSIKPSIIPAVKPSTAPQIIPSIKHEIKSEIKPEVKSELKPELKPEFTAQEVISPSIQSPSASPTPEKRKGLFETLFSRKKEPEQKKEVEKKKESEQNKEPEQKKEAEKKIVSEKQSTPLHEIKKQITSIEEKAKEKVLGEDFVEEKDLSVLESESPELKSSGISAVRPVASEDKRELKANVGAVKSIANIFSPTIQLSENDISDLCFELELGLIESDVEQDVAQELSNSIKQRLISKKLSKNSLDEVIKKEIKEVLIESMTVPKINVLSLAKDSSKSSPKKPFVILILGPNGAGKTTSIAKLTKYFQKNNLSIVLAACDTFRAAAIDQLEVHAKALGVDVVKHAYGSDPSAVAFDAIKFAQSKGIDVVLIDSAGRQETNQQLLDELKKMKRVSNPSLSVYVGEAYSGQGLLDQAIVFDENIGLDGFILTKIDADAKGGTTISLIFKTKKPVLFIGTGQSYDDLAEFSPSFIADRVV